jgi:hypothetical protein
LTICKQPSMLVVDYYYKEGVDYYYKEGVDYYYKEGSREARVRRNFLDTSY